MDDGTEIPGLNEDWSLAGCKLTEWGAGLMAFLIAGELLVENMGRSMPFLLAILFSTTLTLGAIRRRFPDEERGIANVVAVALGFCPPGIPEPAALQPMWSGAPLKNIAEQKEFVMLGLTEVFAPEEEAEED